MAGFDKGAVTVDLGDRTIRLVFDFNAQAEVEALFNMDLGQILARMATAEKAGGMSVRDLRAILWASMLHHQPAMSLREAGDVMAQLGADRLGEVYTNVLRAAGILQDTSSPGDEGNDPAGEATAQ